MDRPIFKVDINLVDDIAITDDEEYILIGNIKEFILCRVNEKGIKSQKFDSPYFDQSGRGRYLFS